MRVRREEPFGPGIGRVAGGRASVKRDRRRHLDRRFLSPSRLARAAHRVSLAAAAAPDQARAALEAAFLAVLSRHHPELSWSAVPVDSARDEDDVELEAA